MGKWTHHLLAFRKTRYHGFSAATFLPAHPQGRSLLVILCFYSLQCGSKHHVSPGPNSSQMSAGQRSRVTAQLLLVSLVALLSSPACSAGAWCPAFLCFAWDTCICFSHTCLLREAISHLLLPIPLFSSLCSFPTSALQHGGESASFLTSCLSAHQPNRCSHTFRDPH